MMLQKKPRKDLAFNKPLSQVIREARERQKTLREFYQSIDKRNKEICGIIS